MTRVRIDHIEMGAGGSIYVEFEDVTPAPEPEPVPPEPTPTGNLTWYGRFGAPAGDGSGISAVEHTYNFGGDAFDVVGDTMWLSSHAKRRWVGECRIPALVSLAGTKEPPVAAPTSPCIDLQGDLDNEGGGRMRLRSIVVESDILWVGPHYYNVSLEPYDALGATTRDGGARLGPFGIVVDGRPMPDQHFGRGICADPNGGYLALGGGLPGQGTTGIGPTLYRFKWAPNSDGDFVADQLLYYPEANPFPGWNMACRPADVVVVGDEVWIACLMASGEIWYGDNTSPNGVVDSYNRSKSYHAEHYEWMWARYSLADLDLGVEPWLPQPIMEPFPPEIPLGSANMGIRLSLDGDRLYILQKWAYRPDGLFLPLIHVYGVS